MKKYIVDSHGVVVLTDNLRKTSAKSVASAPKKKRGSKGSLSNIKPLVPCAVCNSPVRKDRLQEHMEVAHPSRKDAVSEVFKGKVASNGSGRVEERSLTDQRQMASDRLTSPQREQIKCKNISVESYKRVESMDGGKYLGFCQRDSGRFGSLPLYDDYSEDSGVD